jgi:hypothetical protein
VPTRTRRSSEGLMVGSIVGSGVGLKVSENVLGSNAMTGLRMGGLVGPSLGCGMISITKVLVGRGESGTVDAMLVGRGKYGFATAKVALGLTCLDKIKQHPMVIRDLVSLDQGIHRQVDLPTGTRRLDPPWCSQSGCSQACIRPMTKCQWSQPTHPPI